MFRLVKSIEVDMAHIVSGHPGACVNCHGHTWRFEVCVQALRLNNIGFVVDFKDLKTKVLEPVHTLLDHSFACGVDFFQTAEKALIELGTLALSTRGPVVKLSEDALRAQEQLGYKFRPTGLNGAENVICGGWKVSVFPFTPTSERLAQWLHGVAKAALADERVYVSWVKVYETLHPVEAIAEYSEN